MVSPEKRAVKILNDIEFNILEKSRIKNPVRAKEIARHWIRMSR
ncbi:MAG: hypothetical protein QXM31_03420 [Candidatus Woesearchaeota archaeon]